MIVTAIALAACTHSQDWVRWWLPITRTPPGQDSCRQVFHANVHRLSRVQDILPQNLSTGPGIVYSTRTHLYLQIWRQSTPHGRPSDQRGVLQIASPPLWKDFGSWQGGQWTIGWQRSDFGARRSWNGANCLRRCGSRRNKRGSKHHLRVLWGRTDR